jgi:hypothetical protein
MCAELTQYFQAVFDELSRFEKPIADAIGVFIEAKYMIIPVNKTVKRAEAMPNMFLKLKEEFTERFQGRWKVELHPISVFIYYLFVVLIEIE